jgi:hypothetical protein
MATKAHRSDWVPVCLGNGACTKLRGLRYLQLDLALGVPALQVYYKMLPVERQTKIYCFLYYRALYLYYKVLLYTAVLCAVVPYYICGLCTDADESKCK